MSQQENNNLQDDTEPAQGIGVGGYMAAGAEATPSPKTSVHEPVLIVFGFVGEHFIHSIVLQGWLLRSACVECSFLLWLKYTEKEFCRCSWKKYELNIYSFF